MNDEKMSLATIKDGAAVEMFDLALARVLANVADINTDIKPRKITLTVTITPNKDRSIIGISIGCDPVLRNQEKQESYAHVKRDPRGQLFAIEHRAQQDLTFSGPAVVMEIKNKKGGNE
jgi:hypothetical protein